MEIIKPPNRYSGFPKKSIFLAGSIEMGAAENWQDKLSRALADQDIVIFNPRRDNWDSSWVQSISNPQFREQVEWELDHQEQADQIVMYFDPTTKAPISLLELGLAARTGKLTVICPDGFWRKGNVEIVCKRFHIPLYHKMWDFLRSYLMANGG
jgi:hypothetical protein